MITLFSTAYSQDISGQWEGLLSVQGAELRLVLHVWKVNDEYKATMDSPDQQVTGIIVKAVGFSYPQVKFEIATIRALYEGNLSGKEISGKWNQAGRSFDLTLKKSEEKTKVSSK